MATEDDVAAGLIHWVNSLNLAEPVRQIDAFNDGELVWKLLQQIDRYNFAGSLPEDSEQSDEWVHKWTNLKHLYDALTVFLVEECGQKLPLFHAGGRTRPDLKAIAQTSSVPDTVLLLKLCVIAAINCADRVDFLTQMQELDGATQQVLMATAQEAGESEGATDVETEHTDQEDGVGETGLETYNLPVTEGVDSALASEERLGKVIADNQRITLEKREIQKQLDDLYRKFEQSQELIDRTQDELNEANDRLTAVLSGKVDGAQGKPDAKSESVIANLEARVIQAESENDELRKTNEVLKIKADRVQKLQDDFDEIKIERDKLSRKANAAEKYRQKLESIQDMEKDNQGLRVKVQELQTQIRQSDSSQASTSGLQREIDEYRRLLPSIEQERYDLNEMKKRLEFDYHTLEARYHDLHEEYQRSQSQTEDLRGRLSDYEDGVRPSTPIKATETTLRTLEDEEADFADAEARLTEALLNSANNTANGDDKDSEAENGVSEDELRAIMSAMRAQAQAGSATERESGLLAQKKLLIAVDKQRTKNQTLVEHIKKQSDLIQELKVKASSAAVTAREPESDQGPPSVSNAEASSAQPSSQIESQTAQEEREEQKEESEPTSAQKAAAATPISQQELRLAETLQVNENLRREIRLMTSAWYEQSQRIASSSSSTGLGLVSLMRSRTTRGGIAGLGGGGLEEPKSFLGRQRRIVDGIVLNGSGTGTGTGTGTTTLPRAHAVR